MNRQQLYLHRPVNTIPQSERHESVSIYTTTGNNNIMYRRFRQSQSTSQPPSSIAAGGGAVNESSASEVYGRYSNNEVRSVHQHQQQQNHAVSNSNEKSVNQYRYNRSNGSTSPDAYSMMDITSYDNNNIVQPVTPKQPPRTFHRTYVHDENNDRHHNTRNVNNRDDSYLIAPSIIDDDRHYHYAAAAVPTNVPHDYYEHDDMMYHDAYNNDSIGDYPNHADHLPILPTRTTLRESNSTRSVKKMAAIVSPLYDNDERKFGCGSSLNDSGGPSSISSRLSYSQRQLENMVQPPPFINPPRDYNSGYEVNRFRNNSIDDQCERYQYRHFEQNNNTSYRGSPYHYPYDATQNNNRNESNFYERIQSSLLQPTESAAYHHPSRIARQQQQYDDRNTHISHHQQHSFSRSDNIHSNRRTTQFQQQNNSDGYGHDNWQEQSQQDNTASKKMIEITPGTILPLRDSNETLRAIQNDYYVPCSCAICSSTSTSGSIEPLFCIEDADYFICPLCKSVNRLRDGEKEVETHSIHHNRFVSSSCSGGVGLGFTMKTLVALQNEIVSSRYDNLHNNQQQN